MIIAIFLSSAVPQFAVFKEVAYSFDQCIICIIIRTVIWKYRGNLDSVATTHGPVSLLVFPKHFMYVEKVCGHKPMNILPLLGQAAGHSETDLLCVPQSFGQPSEERINQLLSFIVVRHAWSKIPSPSQSTCE